MSEFNKVTYLYGWCQKIIPLVYDDSLSYYENFCKVREKLNEVITNTNMIPDMIKQEVQDFINSGQIEEMIEEMLTGYLQRIVVNVVVPPQGITPAKGNGNDDTETFQQCIDYLTENGGGLLFVPDGDWMVKPLTIKNGVYIAGASVSTKITLIGGSSAGLISGTVTDCGVSRLTLSNNAAQQTVDKAVIDITCNNITLDDLIVKNGYMGVNITTNNGALIRAIRFDTLGYGGLYINGSNADVSVSEITVKNVSQVSGQFGIENDCDHAVFNHISIYGPIPTGFSNTGAGVTLKNSIIVDCGTGIFNVGDDCDFNTLVNGNTEIINDAGKRTSYSFKGQNSQRKIGENVLNLGMATPLMYRTPTVLNQFFNSVPAQDFNGNSYQILTPGENVDKIGIGNAIKLSQIENKTAAGINSIIASGEYDSLIIDTDITLDGTIDGANNFTIMGGGGTIKTTGQAIVATGEVGALIGTGSYAGTLLSGVSGLNVGDTIFLKGTTNLFDRSTLSQQWCLGTGTSGVGYSTVYNSNVAHVISITSDGAVLDVAQDWGGGSYNVYRYTPIVNFKVIGVQIESTSSLRAGTIRIENALNCEIIGCTIKQYSGSAIVLSNNDNGVVDRCYCYISQVWDASISHSQNNIIRLFGCRNCTIQNSQFNNGTQCIDITYTGETDKINANTVSKYCHVIKNLCHSNYTGLTTHPGTFGCDINNNSFYCIQGDGVSIRGAAHNISNNYLRCAKPETTSYGIGFIEGAFRNSKATGNTVINFRFGVEIHESVTDVRDCSFISQWNLIVCNNIFNRCTTFIYIRRDPNSATSTVYAYSLFANNQVIEVNTTLGTPSVILTSEAAGKEIRHLILVNNTFLGISSGNVLALSCPLSFLILGNNFFGSSSLNRGNSGTVNPNANCWEYNSIGYSLTGNTPIPSLYGGTSAPVTPVLGQLYYDSDTLKVWNGSEWVNVVSPTE